MKATAANIKFKDYDFRIIEKESGTFVFDNIRKLEVLCTPEEWVRQNFIRYLVEDLGYSPSLIGVEKGIKVNGLQKRMDIIVYDRNGDPWMIVECKSHKIPLNQKVFDQWAVYNSVLQVPYAVITNGYLTFCCSMSYEDGNNTYLEKLPEFPY